MCGNYHGESMQSHCVNYLSVVCFLFYFVYSRNTVFNNLHIPHTIVLAHNGKVFLLPKNHGRALKAGQLKYFKQMERNSWTVKIYSTAEFSLHIWPALNKYAKMFCSLLVVRQTCTLQNTFFENISPNCFNCAFVNIWLHPRLRFAALQSHYKTLAIHKAGAFTFFLPITLTNQNL